MAPCDLSYALRLSFPSMPTLAGRRDVSAGADGGNSVARVVTSGPDQDLEKIEFVILEAIAASDLEEDRSPE